MAGPEPRAGWLFGPSIDLLAGCGLGYVLLALAVALARPSMARVEAWIPLVILVTGVPHYGATLLRVYGDAPSRRRYAAHAFGLGGLVWLAFLVGLARPAGGALLITLYLSWSPFHYTGQNFGLALMFLHRRGVPVSPTLRRLLSASFTLSFAITFAAWHRAGSGRQDPIYAAGASYRFVPLGIPDPVVKIALVVLGIAWLATTAIAIALVVRGGRARAALPALALVASQALWFVLPSALAVLAPEAWGSAGPASAFIWIALAHSVQYLWVSAHYARGSQGGAGPAWLLRAILAGAAIWVVPAFAFAPGALGRLPFDSGLGLLVAAAVNIHHFILDGAIWKLRDAKVARVLVEGGREPDDLVAAEPARRPPIAWSRVALVTVGALSAAAWISATWEREIGWRHAVAAGDVDRVARAAERLAAVGRDGPRIHAALGRLLARRGREREARVEFQRSLALQPTAAAWVGLGRLDEARGDADAAREDYRRALAIDPTHAAALAGDRALADPDP